MFDFPFLYLSVNFNADYDAIDCVEALTFFEDQNPSINQPLVLLSGFSYQSIMMRDGKLKQSCYVPSSSAEVIGNNLDLVTEILLRVPAKPLLKFKCVSKQWLSLISDPKFCASHTHHQPPTAPSALFLLNYLASSPQLIVPLKNEPMPITTPFLDHLNIPGFCIDQSCNGLLLCSSTCIDSTDLGYWFFICNPTTNHFKRISHPVHKFDKFHHPPVLCLAFDPLKSFNYKVVCFYQVVSGGYQIDVYSSETGSWGLNQIPFVNPPLKIHEWVFCNDAIHWCSLEENSQYFDVSSESVNILPMPPRCQLDITYFGGSRGHLHMGVGISRLVLEFDIWELKEDYSGWFIKYHLDLHSMRRVLANRCPLSVLSLIRAEKEDESTIVFVVDGRAMSYNLYDRRSKMLCDLLQKTNPYSAYLKFHAYEYFETLIHV